MVGTHWDIAWHRSIGRDTFWTPAHMAIYLGGVLAGLSCGYLILSTTFGRGGPPGGSVECGGSADRSAHSFAPGAAWR